MKEAKYSGDASKKFWQRVNKLPRNQGGETAYMLGCALQDLEYRVLRYVENAEAMRNPERGMRKITES